MIIKLDDIFDSAIIGIDVNNEVMIYSKSKMVDAISKNLGCSIFEALEDFEFNYQSARYKGSPIYLEDFN